MSASDIDKKLKAGLAKAVKATGGVHNGVKQKEVYLLKNNVIQSGSLSQPPLVQSERFLLRNAVFTGLSKDLASDTQYKKTDVQLVCDGDYGIGQGDIIERDTDNFIVVSSSPVSTTGITLVNKLVVRKQ